VKDFYLMPRPCYYVYSEISSYVVHFLTQSMPLLTH
jgi:hypothetical protein